MYEHSGVNSMLTPNAPQPSEFMVHQAFESAQASLVLATSTLSHPLSWLVLDCSTVPTHLQQKLGTTAGPWRPCGTGCGRLWAQNIAGVDAWQD